MLAAVEKSRENLVHVGAGADEEEDDQQQRLEVEEGRLEEGERGLTRGSKQTLEAATRIAHHCADSCASSGRCCDGTRLWECVGLIVDNTFVDLAILDFEMLEHYVCPKGLARYWGEGTRLAGLVRLRNSSFVARERSCPHSLLPR